MADDVVFPWGMADYNYAMTSGLPVYYSIVPAFDRFYDAVSFHLFGTSMTQFRVAVFKITAANTLTLVVDAGDVKAALNSSVSLQVITLPGIVDARAGDTFYVGLLSVGGTRAASLMAATTVHAVQSGSVAPTLGTIPEWHQITAVGAAGGQTVFGSTMMLSTSAATNQAARVWGGLGMSVAPPELPAFYSDSFNRIAQPALSLPWASRSDTESFGIYNSTASPGAGSAPAFDYWVPALRDDDHYLQATLGMDMATNADRDINLYLGMRAANQGGAGQCVKLHLYPRGTRQFRIVTVTDAYSNAGLTQRAVPATVPEYGLGDVVKLVADGPIYTAFHNDSPLCSWIDSGVIQPVDADHRQVNMLTSATSTPNLQIVDGIEFGDYGGGVQLVGLTLTPSSEAPYPLSVAANATVTPAAAALTLAGGTPAILAGTAIQPAAAALTLTGGTPVVSTSPHPIQFDAISAIASGANGGTVPLTVAGSHSFVHGGNPIVFVVAIHNTGSPNIVSGAAATYGGVAMTEVFASVIGSNPGKRIRIWALLNPTTAPGTPWQITGLNGSAGGGYTNLVLAQAVSYTGVGSYAYGNYSNTGVGAAESLTGIPSSIDELILQTFAAAAADAGSAGYAIGSYSKTQRATNYDSASALLVGDSYGATDPTDFTATNPSNPYWGAAAIRLIKA